MRRKMAVICFEQILTARTVLELYVKLFGKEFERHSMSVTHADMVGLEPNTMSITDKTLWKGGKMPTFVKNVSTSRKP